MLRNCVQIVVPNFIFRVFLTTSKATLTLFEGALDHSNGSVNLCNPQLCDTEKPQNRQTDASLFCRFLVNSYEIDLVAQVLLRL